ncbi:MAG: transglutaminase family protein [Ornithinimicrobium sp.]
MQRTVTAQLSATVRTTAEVALSVVVSADAETTDEHLSVTVDGVPVEVEEVAGNSGARWHLLREVPVGRFAVDYWATVTSGGSAQELSGGERISYLRPSRYADVDRMESMARALFGSLASADTTASGSDDADGQAADVTTLHAIADYVKQNTAYIVGSSRVTDGASETYLARKGVCRDFAHLTIALLRARGIPARLVSAYAPGLSPMDFHAVVEAHVAGAWYVVDPTRLAPRQSLVRIATGTDAAETAFLTTHSGDLRFGTLSVSAVVDGGLPSDDHAQLVQLT